MIKENFNSLVEISVSNLNVKFQILLICDGIDELKEEDIEDTKITVKVFDI